MKRSKFSESQIITILKVVETGSELITLRPALIVLEATGGLEIPVTAALQDP